MVIPGTTGTAGIMLWCRHEMGLFFDVFINTCNHIGKIMESQSIGQGVCRLVVECEQKGITHTQVTHRGSSH